MKIQVILGSSREGRAIVPVGKWVAKAAAEIEGFEVETVDLRDYDLPMFNEAISPRFNPERKLDEKTKPFLDKLAEADGYIFITPEYNHSISGVLKNALDYLTWELKKKPAAIVSYGGVGGARAAEHLKAILIESRAAIVPEATTLNFDVFQAISADGHLPAAPLANPRGPQSSLTTSLTELAWWTATLKAGRAENPTV